MSLSTGASLITLSLLLNKVSGFYGLLAVLTGYHLNPLQLSMYTYSLLGLGLTVYLGPHIRSQSPFQCLALAWFYILDSIINALYTAAFAVTWFLVLAQHNAGENPAKAGPGAGTIDDTSGFTNPHFNVSSVDVVASPASGAVDGQDATAVATPAPNAAGATGTGNGSLAHGVLQPESMNSIGVIIALWTVRAYFCLIMLSYARFVVRRYIVATASRNLNYTSASTSSNMAENPFAEGQQLGKGWKGKVGRFLISLGPRYFLGREEDESWMAGLGGKFRKSAEDGMSVPKEESTPNTVERERRRRSGTGPPPPPPQLQAPGQPTLSIPLKNMS